ncbi:MAG: RNase adapter RapZ [Eubacteriales bacterium]|nr:RNase adapter RapZ [Eubacteriales bacterium]
MKLVIVSGISGAGKTVALKSMEDMGFYCIDNIPVFLVDKFTELLNETGERYSKVALGIDARSGSDLYALENVFKYMDKSKVDYDILFLDADDKKLIKRFKETRRTHPLAQGGRIADGIRIERERLDWLKKRADYVIDTSSMLTKDLKVQLENIFINDSTYKNLYITVMSFGFKYGIPDDADLVFDVRFLPNPFYDDELREKTGIDKAVKDYVMRDSFGDEFLKKLFDMMDFLVPRYISEGKNQLVIAMGCTGGKHRSVTMAEALYDYLKKDSAYGINIFHRDIKK